MASFAAPSFGAVPFGSFGGKVGGGNAATGTLPLFGWALDDDGVVAVDILVDGVVAGRATYGRSRPGVSKKHPDFPDSLAPGFAIDLDTTRFLNGNHLITARVLSATGETKILRQQRLFQFTNVTGAMLPFGRIEFPNQGAEWYGNCNLTDPARRYSVISGYALDSGVQQADRGVAFVELLIDRALFANSKSDCVDDPALGGLANCYGIRRLDLEKSYPSLPDSPIAGFRFVLDVGLLVELGHYNPGHHILTIRVGDHFGQLANIAEIFVRFQCDEHVGNEGAKGTIGFPAPPGLIYSGFTQLEGWAVDWEGVSTVAIYANGAFVGFAQYGLPRPEIASAYPGYPDSALPGWRFFLDTTKLPNGHNSIQAVATDDLGFTTLLGERVIFIGNPKP